MLVCIRCGRIGVEADGMVFELIKRQWLPTSKTFSKPAGFICDHCLVPIDPWQEAKEALETPDDDYSLDL